MFNLSINVETLREDGGYDDTKVISVSGSVYIYQNGILRGTFKDEPTWGPVQILDEALDRLESAAIEREQA